MRTPMVTREFTTVSATCKFFEIASGTLVDKVITIPSNIDSDSYDKYIRKNYDNNEQRFVLVDKCDKVTKLYGMTVEQFLENAVELDSDTRKPIEQ